MPRRRMLTEICVPRLLPPPSCRRGADVCRRARLMPRFLRRRFDFAPLAAADADAPAPPSRRRDILLPRLPLREAALPPVCFAASRAADAATPPLCLPRRRVAMPRHELMMLPTMMSRVRYAGTAPFTAAIRCRFMLCIDELDAAPPRVCAMRLSPPRRRRCRRAIRRYFTAAMIFASREASAAPRRFSMPFLPPMLSPCRATHRRRCCRRRRGEAPRC